MTANTYKCRSGLVQDRLKDEKLHEITQATCFLQILRKEKDRLAFASGKTVRDGLRYGYARRGRYLVQFLGGDEESTLSMTVGTFTIDEVAPMIEARLADARRELEDAEARLEGLL